MAVLPQPIRVVLADDHAVVRKGIREFLETDEALNVIAEAANGDEALKLILELQPDVAVLDIQMPGQSGIDVTRAVRAARLPVGVLLLTAFDDEPYIRAALQAGANGYVLKTAEAQDIIDAVQAVHEGKSAIDPAITRKLLAQMGRFGDQAAVGHYTLMGMQERADLIGARLSIQSAPGQGTGVELRLRCSASSP